MMNKETGDLGEKKASKYLKKKGYKILEKNYRALRGEIDLICRIDDVLVFVEVKTSKIQSYIPPEQRVTVPKQLQIRKIAEFYLQANRIRNLDSRFDVIGITLDISGKEEIIHLESAFGY